MNSETHISDASSDIFRSAELYDLSIKWDARLTREIPVLVDVFGAPGKGGLIDAGCGTARQAVALAQRGYRVTAADASGEMLDAARRVVEEAVVSVKLVHVPFATLFEAVGGGFDGVYCLGNSLAASGSPAAAQEAIQQLARCLRPGGRMFVQILNFEPLRAQDPCVRPVRTATVDGVEYISTRLFHFVGNLVHVTNVTVWHQNGWQQTAHSAWIYPISVEEMQSWCDAAGLNIDATWGGYDRKPFDIQTSTDLIVVATKV
jgi:glycine/sarcosine N-methyltransferase